MEEKLIPNADPRAADSRKATLGRIAWALLIAATLYVCYFSHLGAIGFVGPDEPRYAWIARDMVETGDWVTPRLYGKPWFEKPVLYYWGAALSFKVFGVSEAAARLPSAVSALLATLALAWLAWRMYGAETARWLLLLLPTTVGMIGFSHAASMDMPFSAMLTIAMVAAAVVLGLIPQHIYVIPSKEPASSAGSERGISLPPAGIPPQSTPWFALIAFGVFLGAAVLAKGPAAIILYGGAMFFWALFTKRWSDAFRLLHPVAIAAFCVTALPWYILCARRNPEFLRVFLLEHNFQRFLTPEFHHVQPFWFYGLVILAACLPWTSIVLWAAVTALPRIRRVRETSPAVTFFVSLAGFCIIFFSLSQSKLPGYVLPAVFPLIFLISLWCAEHCFEKRKSFGAAVLGFAALVLVCSIFADSVLRWRVGLTGVGLIEVLGLIVFLSNLTLGYGVLRTYTRAGHNLARAIGTLVVLSLLFFLDSLMGPLDAHRMSPRALAEEIWNRGIPPERISVYRTRRAWQYGLSFYLHRELTETPEYPNSSGYVVTTNSECFRLDRAVVRFRIVDAGFRGPSADWCLIELKGGGAP